MTRIRPQHIYRVSHMAHSIQVEKYISTLDKTYYCLLEFVYRGRMEDAMEYNTYWRFCIVIMYLSSDRAFGGAIVLLMFTLSDLISIFIICMRVSSVEAIESTTITD